MTREQYRLLIRTALSVVHLLQHAEMPTTARMLREAMDAVIDEWKTTDEAD